MFSVIENSLNLDAVNLDAVHLVKLIFGEYFCYFNANRVSDLLQLDAIHVPVRERVKNIYKFVMWTFFYNERQIAPTHDNIQNHIS